MTLNTHIYSIIAIFVSVIIVISPIPKGYELMFLQPLLFAICYESTNILKASKFKWVSLSVLFVTMFVRYVLCPFLLVLGEYPQTRINDANSLQMAGILMLYEEVIVFVAINYFGKKYLRETGNRHQKFYGINLNNYYLSVVLIAILLIILSPDIIARYHFVFSVTGEEYDLADMKTSTIAGFIVNGARYALIIIFISFFYNKYKKSNKLIYIYYSMSVVFFNACVVYDLSRFSIVLSAATLTYLLLQLYPSHIKTILVQSIWGGIILVGIVSWTKMFSDARGGDDDMNDIAQWASTFQTYFMGMREVGIGMYVYQKLDVSGNWGLIYFMNDVTSNVMGLAKYSIEQFKLIEIYNYHYSGGVSVDKIMPNISASCIYFGYPFAPVISFVFTYFALWFDKKGKESSQIEFKFLYVFAALKCAVLMMQFYSMIISTLVNTILVLFLIIKVNDVLFKRTIANEYIIPLRKLLSTSEWCSRSSKIPGRRLGAKGSSCDGGDKYRSR